MKTTSLYGIPEQSSSYVDNITSLNNNNPIGLGYNPHVDNTGITFMARNNDMQVDQSATMNRIGLGGQTYPGLGNPDISSKYMINTRVSDRKATKKEQNTYISSYNKNLKKIPKRDVDRIIIGVFSNEIKKKISVVECTTPDRKGTQSINDPKMGVVPGKNICSTCRLPLGLCKGHYGLISFNSVAVPNKQKRIPSYIYHPLFIKDVEHVLKCVCHDCGAIRITEDQIKEQKFDLKEGFKRLKAIANYCDKLTDAQCPGNIERTMKKNGEQDLVQCRVSPKFDTSKIDRSNGQLKIKNTIGDKKKITFDIKKAYTILSNISDRDKSLLGFGEYTHPKDMILKNILVIPPAYRNASVSIPGSFSTDKLGDQYITIIRLNNQLLNDDANLTQNDTLTSIYKAYSDLLNKDIKENTNKYGQFTGVLSQFRTKKGIFRDLALGKRVDSTARSVIGPNPDLSIEEVGVPMDWRQYLTIPEKVTYINKSKLQQLLNDGMVKSVTQNGYDKRVNADTKYKIRLRIGDTVNRWLMDGDPAALGRQPSIHKGSIAGLRVKLIPNVANIQLHPDYTSQFNADFDGDEMNLHIPQTLEAMAEVRLIMGIKHCLLDEQANTPMVGLIMSNISSAFILTVANPVIPPQLMLAAKSMLTEKKQLATLNNRLLNEKVRRYSGYGYISMILPERFEYKKGTVTIRNGVMVSGILTKKHIGRSANSIFQVAEKDFGSEVAIKMLNDMSKILNRFLSWYGLSIGAETCSHSNESLNEFKESKLAILRDMVMLSGNALEDPVEEERRKKEIITLLEQPKNMTTEFMTKTFGILDPLSIMITSGAKGGPFNAAQMKVMVGQNYKHGQLFPKTMTGGTRTLPVFEPNDNSPEAFGFESRSFSQGITPAGAFAQASSSVDNLADTALKTGKVGHMNRDANFVMAPCIVHYDGTVRYNGKGKNKSKVVQDMYGLDGCDAAHLENVQMLGENVLMFANIPRLITMLNRKYGYSDFKKTQIPQSMIKELFSARKIYKGPSSNKQIEALIEEDKRSEVRNILNNYISDIMKTDTMLIEYINEDQQDSDIYSQIIYDSNKLREDINYKYMNKIDLDDTDVYLNLDDKEATTLWQEEFELETNNIYGLSDTDQGNFRSYNGHTLPFSDNMFDFITSFGFIHKQMNINNVINEIKRVLTPGGRILIQSYDINNDTDKMLADVDQMSMDYILGNYNPDKYINNMSSQNEFDQLMIYNKFKHISTDYEKETNKYYSLYELME